MSSSQTRASWRRKTLISLAAIAAMGLVALSPVAMTWMTDLSAQWGDLSNIGQAYGGTSAILSGLALIGVSISLLIQNNLNRISQVHLIRQRQFDIVKLALENPQFLYVDGSAATSDPDAALKVYANLFVGHWAMVWDLGEMKEDTLHVVARRLFESGTAREWWDTNGGSYLSSRRRRRFWAILSEESEKAAQVAAEASRSRAAQLTGSGSGRQPPPGSRQTFIVGIAAGVAIGILLQPTGRRFLDKF
ncbi:DUF6082 family protein [Micromonospora sp. WMMC241]|uniref:DUF6082 family protein n=1 Tax=Micromonospora sp. WMMC241 TaxID=3015159 RepID=UPI0022B62875|nr:DUF6082 family protein [Micromonospora sp. WMMC241]MCZ7436743.1 DUF6082 family protein [Micromonospora sp. WMMC241]